MTEPLPPFIVALMVHGVIGGTDVILNHELIAKLPRQAWATTEQVLHALRELLFALIFGALAWFEWHGGLGFVIVALFGLELWVSTIDTDVEWNTRSIPRTERAMHVALFVNIGIVLALTGSALIGWMRAPAGLISADYGWASWVLTAFAALSLAWAVRDSLNVLARRKVARAM